MSDHNPGGELNLDAIDDTPCEIADGWLVDPPTMDEMCEHCGPAVPIVDEFDDQIGLEEQARPVHVVVLLCGHEIVTPTRWEVSS